MFYKIRMRRKGGRGGASAGEEKEERKGGEEEEGGVTSQEGGWWREKRQERGAKRGEGGGGEPASLSILKYQGGVFEYENEKSHGSWGYVVQRGGYIESTAEKARGTRKERNVPPRRGAGKK